MLRNGVLNGWIRVRYHPLFPCRHPSLPSQAKRYRPRSARPSTTGRRVETETSPAEIELLGPTLLDFTPPVLVPLDDVLLLVKAQNRGRLAPRRLPSLLALAIPATRRETKGHRGDSRSDSTICAGESELGSSEDSRRASEARFRRLGAECSAVFATHSPSRRSCQELADVLTESSRGDRRVRFFHSADSDIPTALSLFRDRPPAAQSSALQPD